MTLPPISYEAIPESDERGRCYMCYPPHEADFRSGKSQTLRLCEPVLSRLVSEGKAVVVPVEKQPQ